MSVKFFRLGMWKLSPLFPRKSSLKLIELLLSFRRRVLLQTRQIGKSLIKRY
ncbi:hypothetical protein PGPR2_01190 [Pseudomonas aeruginosa PGPR2]|nr:hypothetical protein PGPR2_01190 [Pseudomonas aeruginosa PGPR2]